MRREDANSNSTDNYDNLSKDDLIKELRERDSSNKVWGKFAQIFGKGVVWLFAGPLLYNKSDQAWKAWVSWLKDKPSQKGNWPEIATGDFISALISRIMSIGWLALIMTLIPFIILGMQTWILYQQNQRIDLQNELLSSQTTIDLLESTSSMRGIILDNSVDSTRLHQGTIDRYLRLGELNSDYAIVVTRELMYDTEPVVAATGAIIYSRLVTSELLDTFDNINLSDELGSEPNTLGVEVFEPVTFKGVDFSNRVLFPGIGLIHIANFENADLSNSVILSAFSDARYVNAILRATHFSYYPSSSSTILLVPEDGRLRYTYRKDSVGTFNQFVNAICQAQTLADVSPKVVHDAVENTCPEKLEGETGERIGW